MILAQYIIGFFFGASAGSFLGAVISRSKIKDQRSKILWGRSRCDSCKRQLKWPENIPIVSYLLLRGRCRTCHSPIPYWLPLIELAGGIGGIWVMNQVAPLTKSPMAILNGAALALIILALTWIFFSDLILGVIPDPAVGIGVIGVIAMGLISHMSLMSLMVRIGIAAAAAGFFLFLVLVTRGRGMGTGDVTLATFLGLWLGWPKILLAVWMAFIFGAVAGLILIGLKLKRFGQTIPFGPFLIVAAIIAAIVNDNWRILIGL